MATDTGDPTTTQPLGATDELAALAELASLDAVMVKQQIEMMEIALGFETRNRYRVMNVNEEIIYYAIEDTAFWNRICFANMRSFKLLIFTEDRNQVLLFSRPMRCSCFCYFCCLQILTVSLPSGAVLGYVRQQCDVRPRYDVLNASSDVIMKIIGPLIPCRVCSDVVFHVYDLNQEEVGIISKKWGGLAREYATDADFFSISFSESFDVKTKAILLGALFLIDYVYFEQ